ncbi:oxidative stress-induced growth inhibitor 2-like [Tribolium madens]|uniref:oxidative stress-induced growth inhibitor 2-like n=1 Tax=Tribolium madens TaxID=41895 RepID=UPI001CF74D7D|nr:oxidative stress-induced growth inhibitor 2-like [Tribolium madens]
MKPGNSSDVVYKEVVIIGNGPSGIALSYMLSGNLPFLISDSHPDEMLSMRLSSAVNRCLVKQDLRHLADGIEGRSTNPVSLLLDALLHPCADIGLEMEPLVEFKKVGAEIDHVVLGKGPPGGSWHKMDPYILTLSLGTWMALPGLPFHSRDSGEKRAFACNVANYYVQYVKEMNLSRYFINNAIATNIAPLKGTRKEREAIERLTENLDRINQSKPCRLSDALNYLLSRGHRKRCCKRPREGLCQGQSPDRKRELRRDRSVSLSCDSISCDSSSDSFSLELKNARVPFRITPVCDPEQKSNWVVETRNVESGETTIYHCKYLVLANGASDLPNRLEFSKVKPDPEWLFHDLRSLEYHLDFYIRSKGAEEVEPVLIVGAGLSAADAVIATRGRNIPVLHVFRNKSADLNKQLPENMYPEYHKVHQMMKDGGSTYPYYTAYPEYTLFDVDETSRSVILASKSGETLKFRVSFAAVLIGSRPDLTFLPQEYNLGVKKDLPIDCKTNTLKINKLTHCVEGFDDLFAVGPLAGDNFVRFIPGGALAVVSELYRKNNDYCCRFT